MSEIDVIQNRSKLLEALRSGQYSQTTNSLRTKVGYCCLGVACDISGLGEWVDTKEGDYSYQIPNEQSQRGSLPKKVQEYYGFMSDNGGYGADISIALSNLNDSGATFEEIADTIEGEPTGMFKE